MRLRRALVGLLALVLLTLGSSFAAIDPNVKVYGNGEEMDIKAIKDNDAYYIKIDSVSKYLNYHNRWYADQKACFILDYSNWRSGTLAVDSNYVAKIIYKNELKYDEYSIEIGLEKSSSDVVKFSKPLVAYNKGYYVSVEFLKKIMNAPISVENGAIKFSYDDTVTDVESFYTEIAVSQEVNESFIKYLIDEINSKEIPLTGDTSITDIYNLKAFESIINKTFWLCDTHFNKSDFINTSTNKAYNSPLKRYTSFKVLSIDTKKMAYIVQIGKSKYSLQLDVFLSYANALDDYPYAILNQDPKKFFKWSSKTWANLDKYDYWTGMTPDMLYITMGKPDDINSTVGSWGRHEQWVYEYSNFDNTYLYFENGKLTSWQD